MTSCGVLKSSRTNTDEPGFWDVPRDVEIGEVEVVDEGGFVVISNPSNLALPEGQKLYIKGKERKSELRLGLERTSSHLSADVTRGEPAVGDVVVYYHRPGHEQVEVWQEAPLTAESIDAEELNLDTPFPILP